MSAQNEYELKSWARKQTLCGIDEAGRGPLAGPCVVCGVILKPYADTTFIDDSKVLTEKKRQEAFSLIYQMSQKVFIEVVTPQTIDELNIFRATQQAMEKIAHQSKSDVILTDAMPLRNGVSHLSIIKGDHLSISIACASIIAKVTRDKIMLEYDKLYPEYGFRTHKGYPTKKHYEAIEKYGVLDIHRKSYKLFKQQTLF